MELSRTFREYISSLNSYGIQDGSLILDKEKWKYGDSSGFLSRISGSFKAPSQTHLAPAVCEAGVDENHLVICGGDIQAIHGSESSIVFGALSDVFDSLPECALDSLFSHFSVSKDSVADFSCSRVSDVVVIYVPQSTSCSLSLTCLSHGKEAEGSIVFCDDIFCVRLFIFIDQGAVLHLKEKTRTAHRLFHYVSEVALAKEAQLYHEKFCADSADTFQFASSSISLAEDSTYQKTLLFHGVGRLQSECFVIDPAPRSRIDCRVAGIAIDDVQLNVFCAVKAANPSVKVSQQSVAVVLDRASYCFYNKIDLCEGASGSIVNQSIRGLLLSDEARIVSVPALNVYLPDVSCHHGVAVGSFDERALFYVMSRGLPLLEARRLLLVAFFQEVLEGVSESTCRYLLENVRDLNLS